MKKQSFLWRYTKETDRQMYFLVLAALFLAGIWLVADQVWPEFTGVVPGPCWIYLVFHVYCPGCGGTRAARALWHGDILQSISYHPFVLYAAVWGLMFVGSQTVARIRKQPEKGMHVRNIYFVIAILLFLGNVIYKNGLMRI